MKALLAFMLIGVSAVSARADATPGATGDAAVDALVDDIFEGRRDAAVARISSIESITGLPRLVTTPAEFVDRLLNCSPRATDKVVAGMPTVDWTCADGPYRTAFDSTSSAPYLIVAEFADPARIEMLARPLVAPPPPIAAPPSPSAQPANVGPSSTAMHLLLEALHKRNAKSFAGLVGPETRVTFGRRDAAAGVTVAESDDVGPAAFAAQFATALDRVGPVASVDCHIESAAGFCTVRARTPRTGMVIMVSGNGETIRSVAMTFVSPSGK